MLRIERISVRMPAGFEHRAPAILRQAAELLAAAPAPSRDRRIEKLSLPPIRVGGAASDGEIAGELARGILSSTEGGDHGG